VADALSALAPAGARVVHPIGRRVQAGILPVIIRLGNLPHDRVRVEAAILVEPFGDFMQASF
jgi:hypothetical protein